MNPIRLVTLLGLSAISGFYAEAAGPGFVLFGGGAAKDIVDSVEPAVHPITAPYYHEDSFVTSDVRAWYLHHDVPDNTLGGEIQVVALQLRLALTERLQLVAYKDGYTDINVGGTALDGSGWNDIAAGLKYKFLSDWEHNLHAAVGVGYEFRYGESSVLQNDDELRVWASINKGFEKWNFGGTVNYLRAVDEGQGTFGNADMVTWHAHVDYRLCDWFSPVVEVNGYHAVNAGPNVLPFHGIDAVDIGGGAGQPVYTAAIGFEARPWDRLALRVAYENDISDNVDLFEDRVTISAVLTF